MADEVNDFLMGGSGSPSFKFEKVGDEVSGEIVSMTLRTQTDINTGEPLSWPDGSPRRYLDVALQTDLRDPDVKDDNGERRVFVRWHMQRAVQDAVRAAGAKGLEKGGRLTVKFTGTEKASKPGLPPAKLYGATYVSPATAFTAPAATEPSDDEGLSEEQKAAFAKLTPEERAAAVSALRAAGVLK